MAAKISQRYLIDPLSDPEAFASVAVGALLTAYVIDRVFHPIIARLASDWHKLAIQVSKFAFLACCLFATYPYSPLPLTALAVAAVVITIHQATPSKGAAEKEIPTKEAKPVQTAIVTGKAGLDSCPETAVRHILEFVKPDETFLIPEEVKTYFDPLKVAKPGQASIVTGNANLHFDTLSLFVQQQFPDYQVVYLKKNSLGAEEAGRLSNFLRQRPKTVLMTASTHVIHSLLPEESCVLGFFTEDPLFAFTLNLTRIKLGDMTAQTSGQLMIHWLKSNSFMLEHPGMAFEDQRVKTIESILRLICEKTDVVYYRDAIWNQFAGYIKATSSLSELKDNEQLLPPFFAYARKVLGIVPSVLISVAQAMREKMNIHFSYCPQHVIIKPTYLVRLSKHALSQARTGHQEQLLSGLGGVEKRHAFVSGCPSADLKRLLQGAIGEDLFEWKIEDMAAIDKSKFQASINDFIDYLWAHPKTVLYISSVIQLQLLGYRDLKFFLDHFPPETQIVCANVSRSMEGDAVLPAFLEQSKRVRLTPLLEKECQQAVNEWIRTHYKDIKFEERAVEAAVKMAFLLLEEEREKLSFIEDLVERTIRSPSSQETPITTIHLWNTFTTLYPEEKRRIEIATSQNQHLQPTLSSLSHVGGVKSLNTIALAIKAEFKVDLPLQAEAPHEMPFFLVNLNEQMREKPQFAVGNERRIAELANGLKGLNKKNALLVGAPGVGKTTLVESIAWMLEKGQIDQSLPLYGKTIYSLDITEMTKGIQYIGTFEERVSQLIGFLKNDKTAVLFIDEIQLILGAGVSLGNPMGSLAQKLKPYLTQEWMSVIGATTPGEAKKWMTGDESAAFLRRFKEIKISEPTVEECQKILLYITRSDKFKDIYPGVTFDEAAIRKAIALTNENPTKAGQPDRSKDLLEKAASAVLNNENKHVTVEVVEAASKQVAESVAL